MHNTSSIGVSLAIVKQIIERYGGRIWAETEPGKGVAFYITFNTKSEDQKNEYRV